MAVMLMVSCAEAAPLRAVVSPSAMPVASAIRLVSFMCIPPRMIQLCDCLSVFVDDDLRYQLSSCIRSLVITRLHIRRRSQTVAAFETTPFHQHSQYCIESSTSLSFR